MQTVCTQIYSERAIKLAQHVQAQGHIKFISFHEAIFQNYAAFSLQC